MHSEMAMAANNEVFDRICSGTGGTFSPWLRSSLVSHSSVPKVGEMVFTVKWQGEAAAGQELLLDVVVHGQRILGVLFLVSAATPQTWISVVLFLLSMALEVGK